jgi:hypothetical protein
MGRQIYYFRFILLFLLTNDLIYPQQENINLRKIKDFSSNLPIILIQPNGSIIPNGNKILVNMKIIFNGEGKRNSLVDSPKAYNGKIGIEIRGSSSTMFPKKQYSIETMDSLNNSKDISLLGLPEENDWVLSSSYNDKTFLRDVLTFNLMNNMGHYSSRFRFCELFLDDNYQGIYILFEKIKRGKNRINISKLTDIDSSGDNLTGGYIIKIDKTAGEDFGGWTSNFPVIGSNMNIVYQYHYPRPDKITQEQQAYIKNVVYKFESVMSSAQYNDTSIGYPKIIDVDSFVDQFIINELSKNVDSYRLSSFLYKDKDSKNPKLFAGPVWDFSLAYGNADYFDGWLTTNLMLDFLTSDKWFLQNDPNQVPFWWIKLSNDDYFMNKVRSRWNKLRENILSLEKINNFIDSLSQYLNEAQQRNFEKWKILGTYVWPNPYDEWTLGTYTEQIEYLKNWISSRVTWIDWLASTTSVIGKNNLANTFSLDQNYPNPFNPATNIGFQITDFGLVTLKIFDVLGREVVELINEMKQPGQYHFTFSAMNYQLSGGVYFYQLIEGNNVSTKKMLYLK